MHFLLNQTEPKVILELKGTLKMILFKSPNLALEETEARKTE